jgi:hypothetical protein
VSGARLNNSTSAYEEGRLTRKEVFRYRVRYFTEGLIIGSRNFVRETAEKVRELLKLKRERRPRKVGPVEGLYSFRAVS